MDGLSALKARPFPFIQILSRVSRTWNFSRVWNRPRFLKSVVRVQIKRPSEIDQAKIAIEWSKVDCFKRIFLLWSQYVLVLSGVIQKCLVYKQYKVKSYSFLIRIQCLHPAVWWDIFIIFNLQEALKILSEFNCVIKNNLALLCKAMKSCINFPLAYSLFFSTALLLHNGLKSIMKEHCTSLLSLNSNIISQDEAQRMNIGKDSVVWPNRLAQWDFHIEQPKTK